MIALQVKEHEFTDKNGETKIWLAVRQYYHYS